MTRAWRLCLLLVLPVAGCTCRPPNVTDVHPQLATVADTLDFGTLPVLNQKQLEVALENVGRAKLTISQLALEKDDGIFSIVSAPSELEGGASEKLVLAFTPLAEASYDDTLSFETDDADHPRVTIHLLGVGSTRAIITVDPPSIDFGRVAECGSQVQLLTITSSGTADLVINSIGFAEGTDPAFSFVGSTRTPAVVATTDVNGLPGSIELTLRVNVPEGATGTLTGGVVITSTDPEHQSLTIPLTATVNRAPVPVIAELGNGAPGQTITLDGSGSMDPDLDDPIAFQWTIVSKPLSSTTTIGDPDAGVTAMTLDPDVPGAYQVQLSVTDATGATSCKPARAQVVAAPAQKLLIEMFWDNAVTDVDLHVLLSNRSLLNTLPDDCYYQNRTPDWGNPGDATDDPELVRDALTGYGPEVFGYVNPVDSTFRVIPVLENTHLADVPDSKVTVRVYLFGVLKAEVTKTLTTAGESWKALDITWPSGVIVESP